MWQQINRGVEITSSINSFFSPTPGSASDFSTYYLVAGGTLNSSAANFRTAVKGVPSGTDRTLKGSLGSEVRVILNVTLDAAGAAITDSEIIAAVNN